MHRPVLALFTLAVLVTPALAQPGVNPSEEREAVRTGWLFSYSAAKELARKTGKPLLVVLRCVP